jgi:hypothetical protein
LQCGDREDLLSPSYDKQCAFLPYHVQASPSYETSSFHLRKREAAIEQAEHETQFFVWQFLPRLRYSQIDSLTHKKAVYLLQR